MSLRNKWQRLFKIGDCSKNVKYLVPNSAAAPLGDKVEGGKFYLLYQVARVFSNPRVRHFFNPGHLRYTYRIFSRLHHDSNFPLVRMSHLTSTVTAAALFCLVAPEWRRFGERRRQEACRTVRPPVRPNQLKIIRWVCGGRSAGAATSRARPSPAEGRRTAPSGAGPSRGGGRPAGRRHTVIRWGRHRLKLFICTVMTGVRWTRGLGQC